MPTLTWADGSSLTWGGISDDPLPPDVVMPSAVVAPDPPPADVQAPVEQTPTLTIAPEDVKAALNAVPPKWSATFHRFLKVMGAALVATLAAYQGNFAALIHDPTVAIAAVGTAILAAGEKFIRWRD